jgi:hypothetical protein
MEAQVTAKRRGRPPKDGEGKRTNFNTRLRNSLRVQLEKDALAAGRSLSEEIEARLEHSLSDAKTWGGQLNTAAHHMLAAVVFTMAGVSRKDPEGWLYDPETFETVLRIWRVALKTAGFPALKDYPDDGAAEEAPR